MELLRISVPSSGPIVQTIDKSLLIAHHAIAISEEPPELKEALSNLFKGGLPHENTFRAKELHKQLMTKITVLGGLENFLTSDEIKNYLKALSNLQKLANEKEKLLFELLNNADAENLVELVNKLEEFEKVVINKQLTTLGTKGSINTVLNSIVDRIMGLLLQEALTKDIYISLGFAVARMNPIWDIPDERELIAKLKSKVLTDDFKQCLYESLKGNKVDKSKLDPIQRKFYYFANSVIWLLLHTPDVGIKYLPRVGKLTKVLVSVSRLVPLIGSVANIFVFGPVDETINIIALHGNEIRELKKEAQIAKKYQELLSEAGGKIGRLKDEGIGIIQTVITTTEKLNPLKRHNK